VSNGKAWQVGCCNKEKIVAIPLVARRDSLRMADLHAQVALQNIPSNFEKPYGNLHVAGKIIRIFKSSVPLKIDDVVEFDVPVAMRGKDIAPDGGTTCWYEDILRQRHMEVCLNGTPSLCSMATDLFEVISGPTESPTIVFDEEDKTEPKKRRWWQWWFTM